MPAGDKYCPTRNARRGISRRHALGAVLIVEALFLASPFLSRAGVPPPAASLERGFAQPLADAKTLLAKRRFGEAVRLLVPILTSRQNALTLLDGRYVDAKLEANRLIGESPEAQQEMERQFGAVARRELEQARRTGSLAATLAVAVEYRHTASGAEALAAVSGLLLDSGRFIEAAAAASELLQFRGPPQRESAAAARLITAWLRLGEHERARAWVAERREFLRRHEIVVEGVHHRLDRWLEDRIANAPKPSRVGQPLRGGETQSLSLLTGSSPTVRPLWRRKVGPGGSMAGVLHRSVLRRAQSGIPPVIQQVPLIVAGTVLVRNPDALAAFDLKTGEPLWSHDLSPGSQEGETSSYSALLEALVDRVYAGGASSALASDGERVFTVIDDVPVAAPPLFGRRGRRMPIDPPAKNSLTAFDVATGERIWKLMEIVTPEAASTGEDTGEDIDFLGPPCVLQNTLYVLARTEEGPMLLALGPRDGKLRWALSLAGFSGFEANAASSSGPACVPVESGGLLLCPTPEGILIAVDLITRTCRWAYRVPPNEDPPRFPPGWGRAFFDTEARWLRNWRETSVLVERGACFFVTPRSSAIHALDLQTGRILWTTAIDNPLFLGSLREGKLLAVGNGAVTALEASNGRVVWQTSVAPPSGHGIASGRSYFLPQQEGGLVRLDVPTGQVQQSLPGDGPPMGNLVPVKEGEAATVSLTHEHLALHPPLSAARSAAVELLRRKPGDESLHRVALLDREAGDFTSAAEHLESLYNKSLTDSSAKKSQPSSEKKDLPIEDKTADNRSGLRRELFETLLADLSRNPAACDKLAPRLIRIAADDGERSSALGRLTQAYLAMGRRDSALQFLLQRAELEEVTPVAVEPGKNRIVGFDRQLRTEIESLWKGSSAEERAHLDLHLARFVDGSIANGTATTLRRVLGWMEPLDWDAQRRQRIEEAVGRGTDWLTLEMPLWEKVAAADRPTAAAAWRRLAESNLARRDRRAAAICYQRLAIEYPRHQFPDGESSDRLLRRAQEDRSLSRELDDHQDDWLGKPEVTTDNQASSTSRFIQLPLEILPGSLFQDLDVAVDRDGKTLRFQGGGQSTYWDLPLPSGGGFRNVFLLYRGWSVGRLVIVQVGTDLIAVSPFDERNESVPRVLWRIDMLDSSPAKESDLSVRFVAGARGMAPDRVSVTDHLGRAAARVGPVRPGYLCYYDRGLLTAVDPLSGQLLWRRTTNRHIDLWSGDESVLVLADRRSQRAEFLRALDGKKTGERSIREIASQVRWLDGREALVERTKGDTVRLSRVDLVSGREEWSRSLATGTQIVRIDVANCAAVDPGGVLSLISLQTGDLRRVGAISGADHCQQVHATSDVNRIYLAFSTPFNDRDNFRANNQRDDSRNPLVNGVICAVDRAAGQLSWTRKFDDGVFALDQPRLAPFLVFSYRHVPPGDEGTGIAWPYLHCIDKRTGRDVYFERFTSVQSFYRAFTETDTSRREIILRLSDASVRFRYPR